jgi:hypothetical protein
MRSRWLLAGVISLLSYQWIAVCAHALGLTPVNPRISYWVNAFDQSRIAGREVARIVHRTSNAETSLRYNIVGVEEQWLNASTFGFFAAKEELKSGKRCYYATLGYGAKDMEVAWKRMNDFKPLYFISLEETVQPPNPNFLNELSIPVLRRIRDDPDFVREPFASKLGVVIFYKNPKKTEDATPGPLGQ